MALTSVPNKKRALWKWMLLFLAAFVLATIGYVMVMTGYDVSDYLIHPCLTIVAAAIILGFYALFVRWMEGHWPTDLSLRRLIPHTLLGLLVGFVFMTLVVSTIVATGSAIMDWNGFLADRQLDMFMLYLAVAVGEEMIFRGVVFRWIDERWNTWIALLVSAIGFGLIHISNDNATWWSSLAIAIEAGLLLGAAYKWSGSLWVPIGIHWAWNYTQGHIFGLAVSGNSTSVTMLNTVASGPDIITGGAFGPEASIVAVVLGAFFTIVFMFNGYWSRRPRR